MSVCCSFGVTADGSSCAFCPHCSDTGCRFFHLFQKPWFEILHPVLENAGIRNLCWARAVNTSSDYSSNYYHRAVNLFNSVNEERTADS